MNHSLCALFILLSLLTTSCASNRAKTIVTMLGAGAAGAAIGASTAPANESTSGHALLWAGVTASAAAIASMFIFDEHARAQDLEKQNSSLQKALSSINGTSSELIYENGQSFSKDLPPEYKSLIQPGRWSIYKLDQWSAQGENTLVHQDKMIKLQPPGLNPNLKSETSENNGDPNEK